MSKGKRAFVKKMPMHTRLRNLKEFADYPVVRKIFHPVPTAPAEPGAACIKLSKDPPSVFKIPSGNANGITTSLFLNSGTKNAVDIAVDEVDTELIHEDYGAFNLVIGICEHANRSITFNLYIPSESENFVGSLLLLERYDEYIIDRINVQQEYRRMGFGKKLIGEAILYLKRTLSHPVLIQALIKENEGGKFFQNCGFELWLKSASMRITESDLQQLGLMNSM